VVCLVFGRWLALMGHHSIKFGRVGQFSWRRSTAGMKAGTRYGPVSICLSVIGRSSI